MSCGNSRPAKSLRCNSVEINDVAHQLRTHRTNPTWNDFVLLSSTVRPHEDPHHAGHRLNRLLNTGSFEIGRGASFIVRGFSPYRCPDSDVGAVAAKIPIAAFASSLDMRSSDANRKLRDAYEELRILSHPPLRSHRNIVELLGISWVRDMSTQGSDIPPAVSYWPVLIQEFSSLGSLPQAWKTMGSNGNPFKTEMKLQLALDVARGLKALHDCDIVHGDLKCENILVFKDGHSYTAKLADFGYSITEPDVQDSLLGGTPPWNAPEDENDLNFIGLKAADYYSLGFVLWRIFTNGDHPFITKTGDIAMELDKIKKFKKVESFWETAFQFVKMALDKDDIFASCFIQSKIKPLFYSTMHITPLERSLRHVVTALEQLDIFDLKKVRVRTLGCMIIGPEGQIGVDLTQLKDMKLGEIMKSKDSEDEKSKREDDEVESTPQDETQSSSDSESESREEEVKTLTGPPRLQTAEESSIHEDDSSEEEVDEVVVASSSRNDAQGSCGSDFDEVLSSVTSKLNLEFWDGSKEEAVEGVKRVLENQGDPRRAFRHPVDESHSDVSQGPMLVFEIAPEDFNDWFVGRLGLPRSAVTSYPSPSKPFDARFDFALSGQGYTSYQKMNKGFKIEGLSMFDSLGPQISIRIQKEHPGATIRMESSTLDLPKSNTEKGQSGKAKIKITKIEDPWTEIKQLLARNGGYVEPDAWTGEPLDNKAALPKVGILSADLSFPEQYSSFVLAFAEQPLKVRRYLVELWETTFKTAPSSERIKLARMLFINYLEVESNKELSSEWLIRAAKEGDMIIQSILPRILSALGMPLPANVAITEWLCKGTVASSRVASAELSKIDPKALEGAQLLSRTRYSGTGINLFKDFEALVSNLASTIIRLSSLQESGDYSGAGNPQEHREWAQEVVSSLQEINLQDTLTNHSWSPDCDGLPEAHHKHWEGYSEDPAKALRDTLRIEQGSVYALNVIGDTVLHFAAARGYVKLLTFLIEEYHPPLTVRNTCWETPLLQAVRAGHADTANLLLDHGAVSTKTRRGETPLHWISRVDEEKQQNLVFRLLQAEGKAGDEGFSPTEVQLVSGFQPQCGSVISFNSTICWAVEDSNPVGLKALLTDQTLEKEYIEEALARSASLWESECFEILYGAYREKFNSQPSEAFLYDCMGYAVALKAPGFFYTLLRHGSLWLRAFQRIRERIQSYGVKPCTTTPSDVGSMTVLTRAAIEATPEMVADLLENGWDTELEVVGQRQQVPIAVAAFFGRHSVFVEMLKYENKDKLAEKMQPLKDGQYVYHWMMEGQHDTLLLLKKLHSLGVPYFENHLTSPFEAAVRNGNFETADALLSFGADIERGCGYGETVSNLRSFMKRGDLRPTLLGCLVYENASYLLPSVRYLSRRGANPTAEASINLNIFHIWAIGGGSDDDIESTEQYFKELRKLYPDKGLLVQLESTQVFNLASLGWAVRCRNSAALRLLVNSPDLLDDLAFEGTAKMAWLLTNPNVLPNGASKDDLDWYSNAASLLKQKNLVMEEDLRSGTVRDLWLDWILRAMKSDDENVRAILKSLGPLLFWPAS